MVSTTHKDAHLKSLTSTPQSSQSHFLAFLRPKAPPSPPLSSYIKKIRTLPSNHLQQNIGVTLTIFAFTPLLDLSKRGPLVRVLERRAPLP